MALSIVIPLYDEREGIAPLAARMREWLAEPPPFSVELVLVDDGSTDGTGSLLSEHFADLPAVVTRHDHNRGLTAALATGLAASGGDLIGWLDSDLTYDPAILTELVAAIESGADVALASCYHPDGGVEGVAGWRLALSRIASISYRWRTRAPLYTFTSMVRVFRREVLEACTPVRGGFLGVTEVLLRAIARGDRIAEVPAVLRRRRVGQSKMRVLRTALGHLGLLWSAKQPGRRQVEHRP